MDRKIETRASNTATFITAALDRGALTAEYGKFMTAEKSIWLLAPIPYLVISAPLQYYSVSCHLPKTIDSVTSQKNVSFLKSKSVSFVFVGGSCGIIKLIK